VNAELGFEQPASEDDPVDNPSLEPQPTDAPEEPPVPATASRVDALRDRFEPAIERSVRRFEEQRRRFPLVDLGHGVYTRFNTFNGSFVAGYLAYRLFLLLLPLILIIVALAGFSDTAAQDASTHLKLGASIAAMVSQAGADAHQSRIALLITGLIGFTVAAWGLLSGLQFASAQAWRIPTRKFPGKAKSFLRLAGSLLLFGLVFYVSALIRRAGTVAGVAGTLTTLASTFVAYFGLGWILPRRSKEWFWLLPGAGAGALGQLGLQLFATFYLPERLAGASQTYGALGIVVTMLSYLYLLGLLLALAPTVNAVVWERYEDDPPGILRRIADRVPIPTTTLGSGYVPEGGTVDTAAPFAGGGPGPVPGPGA
jgi:uncharacterized BrkB/YihY/UPF0761 family membrane protein